MIVGLVSDCRNAVKNVLTVQEAAKVFILKSEIRILKSFHRHIRHPYLRILPVPLRRDAIEGQAKRFGLARSQGRNAHVYRFGVRPVASDHLQRHFFRCATCPMSSLKVTSTTA